MLQLGYQVIIYDAREHGVSSKSYITLGKTEASDLEDIINFRIPVLYSISSVAHLQAAKAYSDSFQD